MEQWKDFTDTSRIAYFSMEIGLSQEIPTYSGGLGVLAGDTVKSSADLNIPLVAVTLASRKGYFKQSLDESGAQHEAPVEWDISERMEQLPARITVPIEGRAVTVTAWLYQTKSPAGGVVPVLFLDTSLRENSPEDQSITDSLYGGDERYRLKQEIVLGIGGVRILQALGFKVFQYHMNEGHAALLTLELLNQTRNINSGSWMNTLEMNRKAVAQRCVFTTHTPVSAGHDRFNYELVHQVLGDDIIPPQQLRELGGDNELNMTTLALQLSRFVNGVAKKHGQVSQRMFPGYEIHAITNGIHPLTWASAYMVSLFNRYIKGWALQPELLVRVDIIPDEEIWDAHQGAKAFLAQYIKEVTGQQLFLDVFTIGFARRVAAYKRNDLIFHDIERLLAMGKGRIQLVFAGKAHPQDNDGKALIQRIYAAARRLDGEITIIYLPNYSIDVAYHLIPGVDVWLNTPTRPLEASGTSGMKSALNGVPNFSVLDGWWIEGHIENVTGWSIGEETKEGSSVGDTNAADAADMYTKLEEQILPLYYDDRAGWVKMMKGAIGKNASYFNTHVMMRRYVTEAYLQR
ncbi:MAG: alpha-glucan family phosphorylase [Desulfuromonadaceae bacterium]|nr:alpha-glucan family phosphorylase [Desulfuromonas sp.]MDY0184527.1 alpha-glucan family phosphorylase [Desulfuromonadaceae bacterium]